MDEPLEHGSITPGTRFRLEAGYEVLEDWSSRVSQTHKNAVYEALFAMLDGSLLRTYRVIDDLQRPNELVVIVRDDLVLRIRINCFDSFKIVHIGPPATSARFGDSVR